MISYSLEEIEMYFKHTQYSQRGQKKNSNVGRGDTKPEAPHVQRAKEQLKRNVRAISKSNCI